MRFHGQRCIHRRRSVPALRGVSASRMQCPRGTASTGRMQMIGAFHALPREAVPSLRAGEARALGPERSWSLWPSGSFQSEKDAPWVAVCMQVRKACRRLSGFTTYWTSAKYFKLYYIHLLVRPVETRHLLSLDCRPAHAPLRQVLIPDDGSGKQTAREACLLDLCHQLTRQWGPQPPFAGGAGGATYRCWPWLYSELFSLASFEVLPSASHW